MTYIEKINSILRPSNSLNPLVVDLFAGCGGLSLGFEAQGFKTHGFEMDADCCATYSKNLKGSCTKAILTTKSEIPLASVS